MLTTRFRAIAPLICLLALLGSAPAQATDWQAWLAELGKLAPGEALQQLEQASEEYQHQADYYYWLGIYTQRAGKPTAQAIEYFERSLMLNPNHAGAWYDYGLALCRIGDRASCHAVLTEAQTRFGLPPGIGNDTQQPIFALAGEFRSHLGHSSNLNFGSGAENINLQLEGQRISLPLGDSSRAQSAYFSDAALDLTLIPTHAPQITASLSIYVRKPLQNRALIGDYRALATELIYAPAPDQKLGLQSYGIKDTLLGSLTAVGSWWKMQHGDNGTQTLLAAEYRRPSSSLASYISLRGELSARLWRSLEGRIGTETDLPHGDRPGRSQQRLILELNLPMQIMQKGQLEITGRWRGAQDSATFSAFFGNERRHIQTWESRLRFSWPLAPRLDLRLEARYTRQRSNIALFDLAERSATLGIAARF